MNATPSPILLLMVFVFFVFILLLLSCVVVGIICLFKLLVDYCRNRFQKSEESVMKVGYTGLEVNGEEGSEGHVDGVEFKEGHMKDVEMV